MGTIEFNETGDPIGRLPAEFAYTIGEFVESVSGEWESSDSKLILNLGFNSKSHIDYEVVKEQPGHRCGPVRTELTGEIDAIAGYNDKTYHDEFAWLSAKENMESLVVRVEALDQSASVGCVLYNTSGSDLGNIELEGDCGVSDEGSSITNVHYLFSRVVDIVNE